MVLPLTDFSGKNSVTCRDQAGQSQGDAVCLRMGWKQDRECQEPPNAAPSPETPGTEHRAHPELCARHLPASPFSLRGALAFPAACKEPAAGGSPTPPPQKQRGVGLQRLSTKECDWGWGWGRRRLQRAGAALEGEIGGSEPGGMGETANHRLQDHGGTLRDVPVSPQGRTGCPHNHPLLWQDPAAPTAITD